MRRTVDIGCGPFENMWASKLSLYTSKAVERVPFCPPFPGRTVISSKHPKMTLSREIGTWGQRTRGQRTTSRTCVIRASCICYVVIYEHCCHI